MTYARLCEHGELKAHVYRSGTGVSWWTIPVVTCPGGSVLPDDTLVIVKEDEEWPKWTEIAGAGNSMMLGLLDALAAAQGSQE